MSTQTKDATSPEKPPILTAYHVRDRDGAETIWMRIASAGQNSDDSDFELQIETIPLDGGQAGSGLNGTYLRRLWDDFSRPAARRPRDRLEQIFLAERAHFLDERFEAPVVRDRLGKRFGLRG